MATIKTVNRKIAASMNCKCRYGDANLFDILQVNINFNGVVESWQVDSKFLSLDKDSIHFYPSVNNGTLSIEWDKAISPHIHKV